MPLRIRGFSRGEVQLYAYSCPDTDMRRDENAHGKTRFSGTPGGGPHNNESARPFAGADSSLEGSSVCVERD